jgi:hypothetical protein
VHNGAVITRLRTRRWPALLAILAVLGQLLLPIAHAQAWAKQNGNSLLYAYCGKVNPVVLEQIVETAPSDVLVALGLEPHKPVKLSCPACSLVHAGLGSLPPALQAFTIDPTAPGHAPPAEIHTTASHLHLSPPSRAPPSLS